MPFTVNSMKLGTKAKVVLACTKRSNKLDSTAFCWCTGKALISCQDAVSTCSAVSCCFLCESQFIRTVLCGTSAEDDAGESKGVLDGNGCYPNCDEVEFVTVDTGKECCNNVATVGGTEIVGIGEAIVIVGGSESWWTVAFAASDKDAFVVCGNVVVRAGETNCWTEVAVGGKVLAKTKAR